MAHRLLDAATATGASAYVNEYSSNYAVQVVVTGSPSAVTVNLEGSLDGVNFVQLGTASAAGMFWVTDTPVKYVRANLATLTGGTSPTVTVTMSAGRT